MVVGGVWVEVVSLFTKECFIEVVVLPPKVYRLSNEAFVMKGSGLSYIADWMQGCDAGYSVRFRTRGAGR